RMGDAGVVELLARGVAADPLVGPDDGRAVAGVAGDALEAQLQPVADLRVAVLAGDGPLAAPTDTGPDLGAVGPSVGRQREQRRVGLDPPVGLVAVGPDDVDDGGADDDAVVDAAAVAGRAAEVAEAVGEHVAGGAAVPPRADEDAGVEAGGVGRERVAVGPGGDLDVGVGHHLDRRGEVAGRFLARRGRGRRGGRGHVLVPGAGCRRPGGADAGCATPLAVLAPGAPTGGLPGLAGGRRDVGGLGPDDDLVGGDVDLDGEVALVGVHRQRDLVLGGEQVVVAVGDGVDDDPGVVVGQPGDRVPVLVVGVDDRHVQQVVVLAVLDPVAAVAVAEGVLQGGDDHRQVELVGDLCPAGGLGGATRAVGPGPLRL